MNPASLLILHQSSSIPIEYTEFQPGASVIWKHSDEIPPHAAAEVDANRVSQCYPSVGHIRSVARVTLAGFSDARIWRVTTEHGDFALRGTADGQVNPVRLAGLHRLLAHVHAAGITQVAVPVLNWQSRTFFSSRGIVWQMEPWKAGQADFHDTPTAARLLAAMHLLAQWHRAAAHFVATVDEQPWFFVTLGPSPAVRERLQVISGYSLSQRAHLRNELQTLPKHEPLQSLGMRILDLFEKMAPVIHKELDSLRDVCVPLQPCLRDVWHDHLLFEGDQVTGLIDPHACRSDSVATDLSRLLRSLVGSDRPTWDDGIQSYQQFRPLSLPERGLIEILDRSSVLLSGMTWLSWIFLEKRRFPHPGRVIERLQGLLPPLEQLAQTA